MNNKLKIKLAKQIIESEFSDKYDKAGKPYKQHIFRVAKRLKKPKVKICALLHDLVEDTNWNINDISKVFGSEISEIIDLLTHKKDDSYDSYIDQISFNETATKVKISDLVDNMDITRLPELKENDIKRLTKYHKAYVKLKTKLNQGS